MARLCPNKIQQGNPITKVTSGSTRSVLHATRTAPNKIRIGRGKAKIYVDLDEAVMLADTLVDLSEQPAR